MKRTNKKGFTTVELVIVIAVIAILAAVLIPTFANLIRKANISADTQLAKNLNTALAMDTAENGTPKDFDDVLDAFYENGFVLANMNPTTEGCFLAWEQETNQILLVEITDTAKVLYSAKKGYGDPDDSWYFAVKNQRLADTITAVLPGVNIEMTILNTTDLNDKINTNGNNEVHIDGSIVTDDGNIIKQDNADAVTTILLGDSKVTGGSANAALEAVPFYVTAGTMNVKDGVISAIGTFIDSDGKPMNAALKAVTGGVLNVEGTTISLKNAAASLIVYAGSAPSLVKDVTIDAITSNNAINASDSDITIQNTNISVDYIAVQATYGANVTIKGGKYHAKTSNLLCVNAQAATITVEDGIFTCDNAAKTFKFYNYTGNKIVLKGGTFNGIAFENLTESAIRGMCNLTNCSKGVNVVKTADAWTITVK